MSVNTQTINLITLKNEVKTFFHELWRFYAFIFTSQRAEQAKRHAGFLKLVAYRYRHERRTRAFAFADGRPGNAPAIGGGIKAKAPRPAERKTAPLPPTNRPAKAPQELMKRDKQRL